ncbi:MAG: hypothetical protein GY787_11030, partial [Alteromonadales bacterium]|nr:hypothetical protein [Alteromonadales bacterium]
MKQFYILSLLLTFNFTFSQVYFEDDFDGSGPGLAGWTLVNNDGLTPHANVGIFTDAWIEADVFTNAGDVVAKSTSWYDPAGTADDWMITPAIILTDDATLSWDAEGENEDYLDGYEVRLSTQTTNLVDFTTILYSTTAANDVWTNRSIDLNTYTGSTVYIAWRNNSTDKYVLRINNVKVEATIARIVIGTTSLATSAALDVTSTDKGLLVPRMNTVQRTGISNPATGLLVFDTNTLTFWFYNGIGSWRNMKPEYDNLGDLIATQNLKLSSNWLSRDDNNEGVFVDPEGNVGIGITTLNTKLHVVGKTIIDGSTMEFANIGNSVFIGEFAGFGDDYTDNHNTGIGHQALEDNVEGIFNTAVGYGSLMDNLDDYNTAVGVFSLFSNTTGEENTGVGRRALQTNITGNKNTGLGAFADVESVNLTNATAIGAYAYVTQSNSLILGSINGVNSATADTKVGIGTTAPNYDLDV